MDVHVLIQLLEVIDAIGIMIALSKQSQILRQGWRKEPKSQRAKESDAMQHFCLRQADLSHVDLVNHWFQYGFKLTHSDLYRSNLSYAHLFQLDLSYSSLMKADLRHANLHSANLEQANLLGVKLDNAKLEGVKWGEKVWQEILGDQSQNISEQRRLYSEAEVIYRNIGRVLRFNGLTEEAGVFFYREMVMRRKQFPRFSTKRILFRLIDAYCGYGEKPLRLIFFSIVKIVFFAMLYVFVGIQHDGNIQAVTLVTPLSDAVSHFFDALYFSLVTFTTLGYGDYSPAGLSRFIASIEALVGSFTIALFVVVFVRHFNR